jgi:ABC transporter substrate binding protein
MGAIQVTSSRKGAKSRTHGRKVRSTGTKTSTPGRKPRAELRQQLESCRRELAEAREHLAEALEQQTATSEVLQVISSSATSKSRYALVGQTSPAYGLRQQNWWRSRLTQSSAKRRQSSGRCGRRQASLAAPGVSRAVLMFNPNTSPHYYVYLRSFEAVPRLIVVEVTAAPVRDTAEAEGAIAKLGREPGGGLIVPPDAFTIAHDQLLVRLAQQHRVPAIYSYRTSVAKGGLMSYGPDPYDNFRRSASYVDRILKGAKPADLPVQQPTKFELAINLKTAKALGLQIPEKLLALADEVIE